jgi:hypothetical protein
MLRNELKRTTEEAKNGCLQNICNEIVEFQRTGYYDLMYKKTKEFGWKETQGIQNNGIEGSQRNRTVEKSQVLNIWENYITEVEPEEETDTDEKGPYILQCEVE